MATASTLAGRLYIMNHQTKTGATVTQKQMLLPLLQTLAEAESALPARSARESVAEKLNIADADKTVFAGEAAGRVNALGRDVRWAKQRAVLDGLIETPLPGMWQITGKGRKALRAARPGVVLTVFTTNSGVALWAACEDALTHVDERSVDLLFTSPPYPLLKKKQYGNLASRDYIDWLSDILAGWKTRLAPGGSLVLNLGDVWEKGRPSLDLYAERLLIRLVDDLGFNLSQRFEWQNPSKLPAPAEWVTIRRERVKPGLERLYWLSLDEHPKANNRNVLNPYSKAMKGRMSCGGEHRCERPSGYTMGEGAFSKDNGGSIPDNLLSIANTASNDGYQQYCRQHDLPIHPARFPSALPEFFIKLTTEPGDLVADIFGGSGTVAHAAEKLGRRWLVAEQMLDYLMGLPGRFGGAPMTFPCRSVDFVLPSA